MFSVLAQAGQWNLRHISNKGHYHYCHKNDFIVFSLNTDMFLWGYSLVSVLKKINYLSNNMASFLWEGCTSKFCAYRATNTGKHLLTGKVFTDCKLI